MTYPKSDSNYLQIGFKPRFLSIQCNVLSAFPGRNYMLLGFVLYYLDCIQQNSGCINKCLLDV